MSFVVWRAMQRDFGTLWTTTFPKFDLAIRYVVESVPEQLQYAVVVSDSAGLIVTPSDIRQHYLELLSTAKPEYETAPPSRDGVLEQCRDCVSTWIGWGKRLAAGVTGPMPSRMMLRRNVSCRINAIADRCGALR